MANATDRGDEMERLSNAARERLEAQRAVASGLKDRETYTAKQIATRCGTDAKTMRKFFRSTFSTVEPVGQGGRYEFDADDLPQIKREFKSWLTRRTIKRPKAASELGGSKSPRPKPITEVHSEAEIAEGKRQAEEVTEFDDNVEDGEPTEEELRELEQIMEEGGI